MAGCAMWFGILTALMLCFATAISYSELSKIYPGAGSSYLYAEQAFLSKTKMFKFARIAKFVVGWASHLYYWVYPGVMVGVTAIFCGYMANQFLPNTFSPAYNSPLFMILVCVVFALGVGWIASRGVVGCTGVNTAINVIQITALIIFTVHRDLPIACSTSKVTWHGISPMAPRSPIRWIRSTRWIPITSPSRIPGRMALRRWMTRASRFTRRRIARSPTTTTRTRHSHRWASIRVIPIRSFRRTRPASWCSARMASRSWCRSRSVTCLPMR